MNKSISLLPLKDQKTSGPVLTHRFRAEISKVSSEKIPGKGDFLMIVQHGTAG